MEKFIIVGEQDRVASRDRDIADREGPPLLGDSVHRGSAGKTHDKDEYEQYRGTAAIHARFPDECRAVVGKQRSEHKHSARMRLMSLRATWLFGMIVLAPLGAAAAEDISVFVNGFVDLGG